MPSGAYRDLLASRGFQCYLWTQFLGAFNDNTYKIVVSLVAVAAAAHGSGHLSTVGVVFMLPFFFFSGHAGQLADMHSKRTVQIAMKWFEVLAMALGIAALHMGSVAAMLAVLFLMALHSTFFSPAKYGIVPQIVSDRDLSRANGLLEMTTFLAIVLGTALGTMMYASWKQQPAAIGAILTALAVAGAAASYGIPRVPPVNPGERFRWNPWAEIIVGLDHLRADRPLWLTVLGISYFWFLGALLQMNVLVFGGEILHAGDLRTGILVTFLAVGIGVGSILAGRLSGDKVELGLVPIGSIGMGMFSLLLAGSGHSYNQTAAALALLGFSGGFFIVPLNALLQQRAGSETGRLLATNNFLNTAGILLASGAFWLCHDYLRLSADRIILLFGIFTLLATVYILTVLPDFLIRFSLWLFTHTVYRIRIAGQEHVPFRGPALLVSNHISFVDGFLVGACVQRFIRFLVWKPYYELKSVNWLFRLMKAIPIAGGDRRGIVESLRRARRELEAGHIVCIFAEGAISRTGNLLPFHRGFEKIVQGLEVPVVPVHLDRLWGSIFSFHRGRFFWKWPRRIPFPVTVTFGPPLASSATAHQVRQAVTELGADAMDYRRGPRDTLPLRFIRNARRRWFSFCMADSSGRKLTYGEVLTAAVLLSRELRNQWAGQEMVGLLLPSSAGGAIANVAVYLAGKTPVNLNFTAGAGALQSAIDQCGIRAVLTSRAFAARSKIELALRLVYLEDLLAGLTGAAKVSAALQALCTPWRLRLPQRAADLATIVFSSGSTGEPKGVMLSHHNVLSNVQAVAQVFWITPEDRLMGVLPLFHSFGFTIGLWFPLVSGCGAVYHYNPVDATTIGELVEKYKATLLISTPTFYGTYTRKCSAGQFASLRAAIVGAERLREPIATAFREKFGKDLLEGYGCTEMGPVVSVNTHDVESQAGTKRGTVGQPLPGVAVKVVDPNTGETVPAGQEGLLLARGPNRMLGYLNQPEKTAEVLRDGWYITGDVAVIDEDGFIRLTDRLARFSKMGGEMVPHGKVEEAILQVLGDGECVVTAVPDEQKGERLVVFHTREDLSPAALWEQLNQTPMPKLWIPKRDSIFHLESLPKLGTGKTDLKALQKLAADAPKRAGA